MNILLIDNGSSYISELKNLLCDHQITHIKYNAITPDQAAFYDLIILSGSHVFSVTNHVNMYEKELELVRKSSKPIIGLSLGFQLIAYAYEGTLKPLENEVHGLRTITISEKSPIFHHLTTQTFQVFDSYNWYVESVGDHMNTLARSETGIEIIQHILKPIYGLQFHPEVQQDKSDGDEIFMNIVKQIEKRYYLR